MESIPCYTKYRQLTLFSLPVEKPLPFFFVCCHKHAWKQGTVDSSKNTSDNVTVVTFWYLLLQSIFQNQHWLNHVWMENYLRVNVWNCDMCHSIALGVVSCFFVVYRSLFLTLFVSPTQYKSQGHFKMQTTYSMAHVILHLNNQIGRLPLTPKTTCSTFPKKSWLLQRLNYRVAALQQTSTSVINKLTYLVVLRSMGELIYS